MQVLRKRIECLTKKKKTEIEPQHYQKTIFKISFTQKLRKEMVYPVLKKVFLFTCR